MRENNKSNQNNQNNQLKGPIGVFDSGFGGLTLLKEMADILPYHNYLYFADTARAPYGSRSQETIYRFTQQAVDYLFNRNCQLIILACNTASSEALRRIQQEYLPINFPSRRVLGVIVPAVEEAIALTGNKIIGVVATEGTVASGAFTRELQKLEPKTEVLQVACPLLAPLVEEGEHNSDLADLMLQKYLMPLKDKNIDTLILGCTHYGLLEDKIRQVMGSNVQIVSEGKVVASKLKDYLLRHPELDNKISQFSSLKFLTTDITGKFQTLGSQFFGKPISPLKIQMD